MPTTGDLLLDSNAIIALLAGDAGLQMKLSSAATYLPIVAVGELYFGARKSSRVTENIFKIDRLIAVSVVLPCDTPTASIYGETKQRLKVKGKMIPENDVWIAAMALRYNLSLATRDHHFDEVDGLTIVAW
jgi:tRNA(fMet)-specific endonuclease VapC